jgi:hypothetical protein
MSSHGINVDKLYDDLQACLKTDKQVQEKAASLIRQVYMLGALNAVDVYKTMLKGTPQ